MYLHPFIRFCRPIEIIPLWQATGLLGHLFQNQVHEVPYSNIKRK